jgi:hypothetical protein
MSTSPVASIDSGSSQRFELRFEPFAQTRRGFAFACDAAGNIDLDRLSHHAFANYMLARTLVGRDYACPVVVRRPADRVVESIMIKGSGMHLAMHAM